jgi:putative ABC transport system permease protein
VVEFRAVSPEFLEVVGVPVLEGRGFADADRAGAPPVALVNEAFVRRFLDGRDALDATVAFDGPERAVIGVVRNVRDLGLRRDARPTVYAPRAQTSAGTTRGMNEWFIASFAVNRLIGRAASGAASDVGADVEEVRAGAQRTRSSASRAGS